MRIVHLTQSTTAEITGGLEYHVDYLTAALRQLGHEVIVVNTASLTNSDSTVDRKPTGLGPRRAPFLPAWVRHSTDILRETLAMFGRRLLRLRHAKRVVEHVNSLRPDLVHQHSYIGELRTCRLLLRDYPLVFTNHTGAYLHLNRWAPTRLLQRQWMKRFSATIAPSRELLPLTRNSWYVPNGVDTKRFFPVSEEDRARLQTRYNCQGRHVFLCARRWAPTKGILYLAEALHHLADSVRSKSIVLFAGNETPGYARYQENVRQVLATSGCETRILGNLDHPALAELMNLSDVCVFPSLMEATSLACLEAMACATPVIGTRTGGLLELIKEGENGWLVPPRDAKSLARQIEGAFNTPPGNLRRMGLRALSMVTKSYTWEVAARRTEKIYRHARWN